MFRMRSPLLLTWLIGGITGAWLLGGDAVKPSGKAILWTDPGDIATRDLAHGPGGAAHEPHGPFHFDKEDLNGTTPKFSLKSADGTKWKLKMGVEARPETAASRLVWAVGYSANEDYFLPEIKVDGLPPRLHRGQEQVGPDGVIHNVRLKREDYKKLGEWAWKNNPFVATREFNGLRTLMAVINNWDLKDVNNAIYSLNGQTVYLVTDLGASFGCPGRCWPTTKAKGDPDEYSRAKFIHSTSAQFVSFEAPGRPGFFRLSNPKEYMMRVHLEWIGKDIPLGDARWMGSLLARLTPDQLRDAFRAAGYEPQDVDELARTVTSRIAALNAL